MAYKKLRLDDAAKMTRNKRPRFESTEEWRLLKADLDKGLKPHEACQVMLTPDDKQKYRITNRRTVARFLQDYLAEHRLPYELRSFQRNGNDFFVIQNLPKKS